MKQTFHTFYDLDYARDIWEVLSPHKTIDDEWDFRYAFFKHLHYTPHFLTAFDGNEPVGLLPLQYNADYGLKPPYAPESAGFLEIFGGDDTDNNELLIKPGYEDVERELLLRAPERTILAPLSLRYKTKYNATLYAKRYELDLTGLTGYEDYLEKYWSGDHRKTMKKQVRRIQKNFAVEIVYNRYEDIDKMIEFNLERFKDESSFRFSYRGEIFKDLIKSFNVQTISVLIDGKVEGVSYGIFHKNVYVGMNAGVNHKIRDLGKLLILMQIERGINLGCKLYDGGKGSGEWKEEFGFIPIPQYLLSLPASLKVVTSV